VTEAAAIQGALPFTGSGDLPTELAIASILLGLGIGARQLGQVGRR
jgi:hypothetical protein